jgi:hypothetical protein
MTFRPAVLIVASIAFLGVNGVEGHQNNPPFIAQDTIIHFNLTSSTDGRGDIKSYQSVNPILNQQSYDPHLPKQLQGRVARSYSYWNFTAVRTKENANDTTSIYMSVVLTTYWDPRDYDGTWYDDPGIIIFMHNDQVLMERDDRGQTTGGASRCGSSSTLTEKPFSIPNSVFVAMNRIGYEARPARFYVCGP